MDSERLAERIRLGEDSSLELKGVGFSGRQVTAPSRAVLADEFAAMANGRGGTCVLGVSDRKREVEGMSPDQLDLVETLVREACNDSISPPLFVFVQRLMLPGADGTARAVLAVDVPRSLFVHNSPGGYFHRVGSSKRKMSPEFLARLFQQRSQARMVRFDEQTVPGALVADLSSPLWERFKSPLTRDVPNDFLHKLGMVAVDENGETRPTVSGLLMGSQEPTRWLKSAFVQAVAYRGTSVAPADRNVPYQLDATFRQSSRNDTLASLMAMCEIPELAWLGTARKHFMDRRGEGVRLILDDSLALSGRLPEYRLLGDDELLLTIWAADPLNGHARTDQDAPSGGS